METEQEQVGLVQQIGRWATVAWGVTSAACLPVDWRVAVGVAVGGGLGLGLYWLYRGLAPALLRASSRGRALALLWLVWTVKLPVIGALLYLVVSRNLASPVGLVVGIGLLPAVATLLAVRMLVTGAREAGRRGVQAP